MTFEQRPKRSEGENPVDICCGNDYRCREQQGKDLGSECAWQV